MKRDLGWTEMQTQVYWHSWCPDNGDAKFFLNRHKFLPSGQTGTWLVQYCVNWEMYHKLTFWYTFQFSVVDSPSRIFSSEPVVSSYNPQTVWRCGGGNVWHQRKRTIDGMSTMRAMDAIRACLNGPHDSARLHKTNVNVADWHEHVLMLQVCVPV